MDYDYHVERARAEIDRGYRAQSEEAAAAHMKLSALHMERARLARAAAEEHAGPRATPRAGQG
jgi:hypothetical protein